MNQNLENIVKLIKSGTYSSPPSAKDFIEAGSRAIIAGTTMGTAVL